MNRGAYSKLFIVTDQYAVDSHTCPKSKRSLDFSSPEVPLSTTLEEHVTDPVELQQPEVG